MQLGHLIIHTVLNHAIHLRSFIAASNQTQKFVLHCQPRCVKFQIQCFLKLYFHDIKRELQIVFRKPVISIYSYFHSKCLARNHLAITGKGVDASWCSG